MNIQQNIDIGQAIVFRNTYLWNDISCDERPRCSVCHSPVVQAFNLRGQIPSNIDRKYYLLLGTQNKTQNNQIVHFEGQFGLSQIFWDPLSALTTVTRTIDDHSFVFKKEPFGSLKNEKNHWIFTNVSLIK